jgi:hypothetical protein
MRAIVEALQPAILATLAIGTAASSMRKIWVKSSNLYRACLLRNWSIFVGDQAILSKEAGEPDHFAAENVRLAHGSTR